ncbi:unnamed protein product [Clavelina lepadiformis]|uniref:Major facilitator superfamily (MFS) profile domain-containing protein n=1 Tax=Clavelina lepadiformis TaxID=159417 RepID=A0ABP0F3T4_CLALP
MIDFDVILEKIGGLGRYQVLLVAMVCYYSIPSGFNSLAPVFMNYKPEYRCKVPPIDSNFNLTENEILNLTTPVDASGAYATCQRYGYNLSLCETDLSCVNKSAGPIQCDLGYHYDTSIFPQTVITEFNLVCDQAYLDPVATSIYMVGVLIGSIVFGIISDKWGRKPTMISTAVLGFAALIGTSFVHNYWLFVFCRFVVAFLGYGTYLSSFVYLLEITSNKWRTLIGVSFQLVFAVGYMILSGIAYYWRNWHKMNFVTGVLGLPYAVFLIFIPESPRWLFSNGKEEEGKKISRKFAKYNKVELDENIIWKEAEMSAEKKKVNTWRACNVAGLKPFFQHLPPLFRRKIPSRRTAELTPPLISSGQEESESSALK